VADDIDALHTHAVAGAEIITPLHDTDYGSRDFGIKDPEGNRWMFGTYPGAPVPPGSAIGAGRSVRALRRARAE
jgi:hypothetical protein